MKIKKIKKNGLKYKIFLEDGSILNTFDEVIIKNNILFKKSLSLELIEKIKSESDYYCVYNKVLNLIDKRIRSEHEISVYLDKEKFLNKDELISELKEKGFIDDFLFARAFISDKVRLSNEGKGKIKKELLVHNIDEGFIDSELLRYDDEFFVSKVDKIILKKISSNRKDSEFILKKKILNYLINLGYDKDFIEGRFYFFNFSNCDKDREMKKIYDKLSLKYCDEKLIYKFREKLFSKGFKVDEINDFLSKML